MTSTAVDQQDEAFFIKGVDSCVVLPANQANGAFCSATMPVIAPSLAVTKSAPSPGLSVGAQSTYTLNVTNTGNMAATTARISDQLPTGLTFVSASGTGWSCSNASGLVTCNYSGSIAATNGTSAVAITVSTNAGTGGQTLVNYASIDPTGGTSPPTPGPSCTTSGSCASSSSTVSAPNLSVVKAAPSPGLSVGSQSTYTLTVSNTGTAAATTARISDQLPTGLTFVSASGTGWSCSNASGLVTCNYSGSIAATNGTSAVAITVSTNAGTGGQTLVNYASIDPTGGTNPPTPGPSCTTSGSCASASSVVGAASLSLVKSAPSPALRVGNQSTYTLTVTNNGTVASSTAQIKDQLPTGLTFVSASGTGWACTNASGLVTCNFSGTIAASGGTTAVAINVSADAGTSGQSLANHASIDPTGGSNPPTPGPSCTTSGNCASNTSTVSAPDLSIVKAAPTPALQIGAQSTYLLTVTNSGSAAATTARAKDQLPAGLTFVSASGSGWSCSHASGLVTCDYTGNIAASGGTSTFNVVVTTNAGTNGQSLMNYASIDPTGGTNPPTPGPSCNTSGVCSSNSAPVAMPSLTLVKSTPSPALSIGAQSTYLITVTNSGSGAATAAQVKDQLPAGQSFVSASGTGWACTNASGLVTCNFTGTIAASGGTSALAIVVRTVSGTSGQSVTNYATVGPTGAPDAPTPSPGSCPVGTCSSSIGMLSAPNLTIAKAAPVPGLDVGAQSTYVLTVTNGGNAAATSAQVKDQLPSGLTFVSASGSGWSCSSAGGLVTCNYSGTIAAGGGTSRVNVVVTPAASVGGRSITNYASVDPSGGSSAPSPGAACSPTSSCASVSSIVGVTKIRSEAIVHNFLAKRGDRIASHGLDLNRLVGRVSEDNCVDGDPQHNASQLTPAVPSLVRAPNAIAATSASAPYAARTIGDATSTDGASDSRRMEFAGGLGASLQAKSNPAPASPPSYAADSGDGTRSAPGAMGLGLVGNGTGEQGRMSLSGSLAEQRKARAAADLARTGYQQPESCEERQRRNRFDVWFEGTIDYFGYSSAKGQFGLMKIGVDYRIAPGVLVGVLAQFDRTQEKSASLGYLVKGNGWMVGPYAAMKLGSNMFLDARVLRGSSSNEISPYLTYTDEFSSQRWLAAARLSGRWSWNNVSLTPSIEYVHFSDRSSGYVSSAGMQIDAQKVTINRLIFGPEVRYVTELDRNTSLGLHFSAKGLWDANPLALRSLDGISTPDRRSDLHARFDLGATITSKSGVSLDLGVGYEGLGRDGYSSRSATGRLKIPLN